MIVACKLPNGHVLQHNGVSVVLNGSNHASAVAGFGLTEVDTAFYKAWEDVHAKAKYAPLKAGLIFAHEKLENARAEAAEKTAVKTGFEGMSQEVDGITEEENAAKARKGS